MKFEFIDLKTKSVVAKTKIVNGLSKVFFITVFFISTGNIWAGNLDSLRNAVLEGDLEGRNIINYVRDISKLPLLSDQVAELYFLNDLKNVQKSDVNSFLWAQRGEFYFDMGKSDSAKMDYYRSVKLMPETVEDSILRGSTYIKLGVFYNLRGDMDSALFYYNKAHLFFDDEKHKSFKARLLNNESNTYMSMGYVETSLERLMKAHDYFVELGDENTTALTLMNMGDRYFNFNEPEKALKYERKAISIFKRLNDKQRLAEVYTNISNSFSALDKYDSARYYITRAIKIKRDFGNMSDLLVSLHGLAKLELNTGDYKRSIQLSDSVYQASQQMGILPGIYYSLLAKAEAYYGAGNYDSSLINLRKLSDFINATRAPVTMDNVYFAYSDVFMELGQYDSSLHYFKLHNALKDSIAEKKRKSRVEELKVMFETEQKELENQKLKNQALIKSAEEERQKALLIAMAIGIIVVSAFAGILYRYNAVKSKANKSLEVINSSQKKHNSKLEKLNTVKNKLFSIIGHDLRSPVGSLVSILNMINSDKLDKDEQKVLLLELEGQATVSLALIENVMHWAKTQMDGVKVKPDVINARLRIVENLALFEAQAKQKDIEIINEVTDSIKAYVDPNMLNIVFRNLITNAIKFTPAKGIIKISASQKNGDVVFCVIDSGKGMNKELQNSLFEADYSTTGTQNEKGTGLGLFLTKDAVETSGGKIWVESEVGKGSKFCFSLPATKPE